ncbi:MAG: carbohydrate ABC transporter permease [Clostridia bacterium]|nr:carbohydrate ABC transporter permease [Clostridia bacterium]
MNAENMQKPRVMKESKNKIRVEFERTSLKERLKARFLNVSFLMNIVWAIFRYVLLVGVSYVVLYPFISKIAASLMGPNDFVNATVRLIPTKVNFDIYKMVFIEMEYMKAFWNTLFLSASTALIQTLMCCVIAYGLAKFKFKGNNYIFYLVMFTMIVPHQTVQLSLYMAFRYFDILGIFQFLGGGGITIFGKTFLQGVIDLAPETSKIWSATGLNLVNTYWPLIILSLVGLAFKNGLYIFMLKQFFRGVPDELEESAYMDGSGVFRTFIQIILPLSIPMMITVFLFAFSWQWTDDFYTELFFTTTKTVLMPDIIGIPTTLETNYAGQSLYYAAIRNTCGLMIIAPLVIMYLFCQRFLVQGIERSGLTAD